jgi:alpha-L-arabinofuranosidase
VHGDSIQCYLDDQLVHDVKYPTMKSLYASATRSEKTADLILKVVNVAQAPVQTRIDLAGVSKVASEARAIVLTSANATDENSLLEPRKVAPVSTTEPISGPSFDRTFPGNSVTVLRVKTVL